SPFGPRTRHRTGTESEPAQNRKTLRGARSAPPNPETSAYPTFRGAPDPYDGRPNMPSVPSKELVTIANPHPGREYEVECVCPEFTCICPMTSQPDFATFTITYVPGPKILELKSLKLYLWSFRNEGVFHEDVTNRILDDLVTKLDPKRVSITSVWNVRGGISTTVR